MGHVSIFLTILFTVYGQLIIKQQVATFTDIPTEGLRFLPYFTKMILIKPLLLSGFVSAFLASLCWMSAVSRFDLSYAYPFMSLNFVLVVGLSVIFFGDTVNAYKVLGLCLICGGVVLIARA